MDPSTRFAKCFKISTENSKTWALKVVEKKVCSPNLTLEQYIRLNPNIATDKMVAKALPKMQSSNDLDISAICAIIRRGNILNPIEMKSTGHVRKTVGDYIDRIRQTRNDIVHSGEATLDEVEYKGYLDEFRDIARGMEKVNGEAVDTYRKEIDAIDREHWADQVVKDELQRYKVYMETIVYEIQPCYDSYTKYFAAVGASQTDNPLMQAIGGFVGGAVGLYVDATKAAKRQENP